MPIGVGGGGGGGFVVVAAIAGICVHVSYVCVWKNAKNRSRMAVPKNAALIAPPPVVGGPPCERS